MRSAPNPRAVHRHDRRRAPTARRGETHLSWLAPRRADCLRLSSRQAVHGDLKTIADAANGSNPKAVPEGRELLPQETYIGSRENTVGWQSLIPRELPDLRNGQRRSGTLEKGREEL